MKHRKFTAAVAIFLAFSLVFNGSVAFAQSYDPAQDLPRPTLLQMRLEKLGRGLGNVLFGWAEIPVTWNDKMREGKPLSYLLSTALVIGTTKAVMRTGLGVWEIVTFPTSPEEVNFAPLIEPAYVF